MQCVALHTVLAAHAGAGLSAPAAAAGDPRAAVRGVPAAAAAHSQRLGGAAASAQPQQLASSRENS